MALTSGTREMAQRVRRPRQYESATTSICGLFRVGVRIAQHMRRTVLTVGSHFMKNLPEKQTPEKYAPGALSNAKDQLFDAYNDLQGSRFCLDCVAGGVGSASCSTRQAAADARKGRHFEEASLKAAASRCGCESTAVREVRCDKCGHLILRKPNQAYGAEPPESQRFSLDHPALAPFFDRVLR